MPQSPTIEPTERSMPPVMMTKVMPMARIAFSATCLARITMLATLRKFGAAKREEDEDRDQRDEGPRLQQQQQRSVAAEARRRRALASEVMRASPVRRLAHVLPRRRRRWPPRPPPAPSKFAGDPAVRHHEDPVRQRHHLLEVRGDEEDAEALGRQPPHGRGRPRPWRRCRCRGDGSSISSTFGLVISALPITTFCWLPPESALIGFSGLATLIASSRTKSRTRAASAARLRWKPRVKSPSEASDMFSRTDMIWIVPERLAVLGDQRDPPRDPPRDVRSRERLAVEEERARSHAGAAP